MKSYTFKQASVYSEKTWTIEGTRVTTPNGNAIELKDVTNLKIKVSTSADKFGRYESTMLLHTRAAQYTIANISGKNESHRMEALRLIRDIADILSHEKPDIKIRKSSGGGIIHAFVVVLGFIIFLIGVFNLIVSVAGSSSFAKSYMLKGFLMMPLGVILAIFGFSFRASSPLSPDATRDWIDAIIASEQQL